MKNEEQGMSKLIHDTIKGAERQYGTQPFLTRWREIRIYIVTVIAYYMHKDTELQENNYYL